MILNVKDATRHLKIRWYAVNPNMGLSNQGLKPLFGLDPRAICGIYPPYLLTLDWPITIDNQPAVGSPIP
ncbi:hypothetical protein BVZ32_04625 [Alcaligenes faecalis]|nr:hypothetical protein BVZ30_12485 [Alcaligenes faecalis]OSZ54513.1 hypothetical protein BVZ32_04625 [Alcaligenes faecalis]